MPLAPESVLSGCIMCGLPIGSRDRALPTGPCHESQGPGVSWLKSKPRLGTGASAEPGVGGHPVWLPPCWSSLTSLSSPSQGACCKCRPNLPVPWQVKLRDPQAAVQTVSPTSALLLSCTAACLEEPGAWLSPCDRALILSPGGRNWGSVLSPWAPSLFYWLPSSSQSRGLPQLITPTPDSSWPDHLPAQGHRPLQQSWLPGQPLPGPCSLTGVGLSLCAWSGLGMCQHQREGRTEKQAKGPGLSGRSEGTRCQVGLDWPCPGEI